MFDRRGVLCVTWTCQRGRETTFTERWSGPDFYVLKPIEGRVPPGGVACVSEAGFRNLILTSTKAASFAERLTMHARTEEKVLYPAAILVVEILNARGTKLREAEGLPCSERRLLKLQRHVVAIGGQNEGTGLPSRRGPVTPLTRGAWNFDGNARRRRRGWGSSFSARFWALATS